MARTVVGGVTVPEVVVVVEAMSAPGDGAGSAPAAPRSGDVGTVERVPGAETRGREAVTTPWVRAASRDAPAQTSAAEIVPTTTNRSAFIREVLLLPCHQSRSGSDAPGRPNGAFFPMARTER